MNCLLNRGKILLVNIRRPAPRSPKVRVCFMSAAAALLIAGIAACQRADSSAARANGQGKSASVTQVRQPPLKALDETTATEFRRAFDENRDRTRFIVALSPT